MESWSGRSSSSRSENSDGPEGTRWRWVTSSQSSNSWGNSLPQLTASGFEVVGRRTATRANWVSVIALNRLDLPEPVAPANATTV